MHRLFFGAGARRLTGGWLRPLALLTLPACGLSTAGLPKTSNFDPGNAPISSAVFCDIEKNEPRQCATGDEAQKGIRLKGGAIALVAGASSWGVDYSDAATTACSGQPQIVQFEGPFPAGLKVCLNCGQLPEIYADATAVCVAKCEDITAPGTIGDPAIHQSCVARARVSTNANMPACLNNVCSSSGEPLDPFVDQRIHPEPVIWHDAINVGVSGPNSNSLSRTSAPNPTNAFDAGADSDASQAIDAGDGYVEFTVAAGQVLNFARLGGLTQGDPSDPDYTHISFAIDLFTDGCFYVFESGAKAGGTVQGCAQPDAFGAFAEGDKFRVQVEENPDGLTATVKYFHITGACNDGAPCNGADMPFYTSTLTATYPLRVDASFREPKGMLEDVKIVRVRQ